MTERERTVTEAHRAECQGCAWQDAAAGALGRAALHHDRSGHQVRIVVERIVTYGNRDAMLLEQGQTTLEGIR